MKINTLYCARSWRTTITGLALVALGFARLAGYHVDGIETSPEILFLTGFGLVFAKDANH